MLNRKIIWIISLIFLFGQSLAKPTIETNKREDGNDQTILTCDMNNQSTHGSCDPGYYLLKIDNQLASEANQNGYLYYCDGEKCEQNYDYGYFKNADKDHNNIIPYIYCERYSNDDEYLLDEDTQQYYPCKTVASPDQEKTSCNNKGDFINVTTGESPNEETTVYVCLDKNGPSIPFGNQPIFYEKDDNNCFIYISDENSIRIAKHEKGVFFVDTENNVTAEPGKSGKIYICDGDSCYMMKSYGSYLYNELYDMASDKDGLVPYIQCFKDNKKEIVCSTIEAVTNDKCADSGENAAKAGELFLTTENTGTEEEPVNKTFYNLCLDTTGNQSVSVKLNGYVSNNIRYFLSLNNENSIFGYKNNIYCIIVLDKYDIITERGDRALYKYSKNDNKVFIKGDVCEMNDDPLTFTEYGYISESDMDYTDGDQHYRKITS